MSTEALFGGLDAFARNSRQAVDRLTQRVRAAVVIGASMVEEDAKKNVVDNGSVVSGNLLQSIGTQLSVEGDVLTARVGTAVKYAAGYEFGVAADEGDFQSEEFAAAILDWVRIKGIDAEWGLSAEEAAFIIVRHIQEFGTQPHPFLIPAYQRHQQEIAELITKSFQGKPRSLNDS
jgi:phage gpG-like protein